MALFHTKLNNKDTVHYTVGGIFIYKNLRLIRCGRVVPNAVGGERINYG